MSTCATESDVKITRQFGRIFFVPIIEKHIPIQNQKSAFPEHAQRIGKAETKTYRRIHIVFVILPPFRLPTLDAFAKK